MTFYIPNWEYAGIWFCLSFTIMTCVFAIVR